MDGTAVATLAASTTSLIVSTITLITERGFFFAISPWPKARRRLARFITVDSELGILAAPRDQIAGDCLVPFHADNSAALGAGD